MSRILKIILGLFAVILLGALIWFWFSQRQQPEPEPEPQPEAETEEADNLANINAQDYNDILKSNFATASKKALEWKNDAQFVFIKVQIPGDLNLKKITETYIFTSTTSKTLYWTIGFDLEKNYIRALIWKDDFLKGENPKKIATQFWETDWITAFQKAETAGGKEFREEHQEDLEITINLTHAQPKNYLYWIVTYTSLGSGDKKIVQINASTGEVLEESDDSESSEEESETSEIPET